MVKNNPIQFYLDDGWVITSDPHKYYESYNPNRNKKPFGKRDLMSYGINADAYCGGFHRAYDFVKWHNAPIKAFADGTVLNGTGWNTFGWTLVLSFKDANGRMFQVVFGHLNRNPLLDFKVGDKVKKGQVVAYQGASNNLGVTMASHLHIQFQNYQAYNEWNFTCLGIDPLAIDIGDGKTTTQASKPVTKKPTKKETPSTFNKRKGRKARARAYAKGVVRSTNGKGAAYRRWSGDANGNPTFRNRFGNDIKDGSVVYIFSTHKSGWARIYSSTNKGWIHLDQVQITEVY